MSRQKTIRRMREVATLFIIAGMASPALAAAGGMPWETPLQSIADSITGPVAKIAGVIAVALCGLGFAFAEGGGVMRKMIGIVFGLAIAFSASNLLSQFLRLRRRRWFLTVERGRDIDGFEVPVS